MKLWDSLSWFVLVEFGEVEMSRLLRDGMVQLKCRACGGLQEGTKKLQRPKRFADVENWLAFLDAPLLVRGCNEHRLEFHATREFRERSLSARGMGRPDMIGSGRAKSFVSVGSSDLPNNKTFRAVEVSSDEFQDEVYDHLVRSIDRNRASRLEQAVI